MIVQVKDPNSGAILFKKDEESITLEQAIIRIEELENIVKSMDKRIRKLENKIKVLESN